MISEQRYTEHARDAFAAAQEEAARTGSPEVRPELLLAGLLHRRESVAARMLEWSGIPRIVGEGWSHDRRRHHPLFPPSALNAAPIVCRRRSSASA